MLTNPVTDPALRPVSRFLFALLVTCVMTTGSFAQDADVAEAATDAAVETAEAVEATPDAATTEEPVTEEPVTEEPAEEEAGAEETPSTEPPVEPAATEPAATETAATETAEAEPETPAAPATEEISAAGEVAGDAEASSFSFSGALTTLAVIVLPILIGNGLAKKYRMKEHAWKISAMLLAFAVAGVAVATGELKGGPDLAGGVTLVYEVANQSTGVETPAAKLAEGEEASDEATEENSADESSEATTEESSEESTEAVGRKVKVDDRLIGALKQRIDPSGTKEVSIRQFGDVIQIIIPKAGEEELNYIKRRISESGQLEFRITANHNWPKDQAIIEKALKMPPSKKIVMVNDRPRAEWIIFDEREFSQQDSRLVQRTAGSRREALVLYDRQNVTGDYLVNAAKGYGDKGQAIVDFVLNSKGGHLFGRLTGDNLPDPSTGAKRQLGILIDKKLISAPSLNSRITNRGQITMSGDEKEVEFLVEILNAGSLPTSLNPIPISEETVSPTLGAETIEKGKKAITISLIGVLLFILFYYRFAGVVACFALTGTLLLVLGAMVIMRAAFTLPGLAGLVLTIGMAVDANVLIFERIREELAKGSSLRMAISNGWSRATTTIVDANLTTLITGFVLYTIGTDEIRGFAVTLVLGIMMSMFTAIFCSRIIFDIAERQRWIKGLNFASILGKTDFNFIGMRHVATLLSLLVIAVGMAGVYYRGDDLLNIDFTGGSSVTMVLEEPQELGDVREQLEATELGDMNLLVVALGETNTRFTINSSIEEVADMEALIASTFDDKLQHYELEVGSPIAYSEPAGEGVESFEAIDIPLAFNQSDSFGDNDGMARDPLADRIQRILAEQGHVGMLPILINDDYTEGTNQLFKEWKLRLELPEADSVAVANALHDSFVSRPVFPLANKIGSRVAGDLSQKAISAIVVSLLGIVGYLWFRFQNIAFGLAAVVALVHDVLVTLGAIALSAYVLNAIPSLGGALQLDAFQISLPIVAAFVTIIGYSLNDTIVVFDRIREVRGKSPNIKAAMVNKSINQTLSRTLLTSITTLIVVLILYFMGGSGIHGFAFSLVIGVLVGTYSSVFVASPALLWMTDRGLGREEMIEE